MSSGHFHSTDLPEEDAKSELALAFKNGKFKEWYNWGRFRVDRDFDIPYLAGYSLSGKIIYVDRHLPISLLVGAKRVNVIPFLVTHERTEKGLLMFFDKNYDEAHKVATYAEHKALKQAGISPRLYEVALDPFIKADRHEKIVRVPGDLDLKPYRDSRDLKLIAKMKDRRVDAD